MVPHAISNLFEYGMEVAVVTVTINFEQPIREDGMTNGRDHLTDIPAASRSHGARGDPKIMTT
jgi:hypothetical protein